MTTTTATTTEVVERYVRLLWQSAEVRELRILGGPTQVGYFDDPAALTAAAAAWDGRSNLYLTINPVDTALLARAVNRIRRSREATSDKDIVSRRFLPIDIDPVRPAGISATGAEVAASLERARGVAEFLQGEGWRLPITSFSGNGHQLLYPIELPNDQASSALVAGVLRQLAARFDDERVKIDTSVSNAARIMALIGTMKVKGDHTTERPHRRSELMHAPDELEPVSADALAALLPADAASRVSVGGSGGEAPGWVRRWLDAAGVAHHEQPPDAAGIVWFGVESCPYHPGDGVAWQCGVGEAPDGHATGKCFHDRGADKGWQDFKRDLGLRAPGRTGLDTATAMGGSTDDLCLLPPPKDPMRVATRLVDERYRHPDGSIELRHWRGGFWQWTGPHWAELEGDELDASAYRYTEDAVWLKDDELVPWAPTRHKIGDLLGAMKAVAHTESSVTMPSWSTMVRDGGDASTGDVIVSCSNGLLDVTARTLQPHHPTYFNGVSVPFAFDPAAPAPRGWLRFLDELWPNDSAAIDALAEFFGYVISGRLDLHKVLLVIGPTRAGKGVIARILKTLVGLRNCAGPTLSSLGQNFGLQPLIGKPLAIVSDARLGGAATNIVVERLLSISGEDMLTVDRKFKPAWTGTLPTRFLVISNELPRFGDASGAIANRFIILSLERSWLGHEDPALTRKLLSELPGILGWALDGLDRLAHRGHFSEPASSQEAKLALADLVSPVSAFTRDRCVVGMGHTVSCQALYEEWRTWAEDSGHRPGSTNIFGRNLRAVVPTLRTARPRAGDQRDRWYRGICLGGAGCADHCGPLRTRDAREPADDEVVRNGPQSSRPSSPPHADGAPASGDLRDEATAIWADDGFEWGPPDDDRGALDETQESGSW